jgi:hypothetical protein
MNRGVEDRAIRIESNEVFGFRATKALERAQIVDRLEKVRLSSTIVAMNHVEVRPWLEGERLEVPKGLYPKRGQAGRSLCPARIPRQRFA